MSAILDQNSSDLRLYERAEAALPNPAPFMDQARDELMDKLMAGKKVNGMNSRDIFDSRCDGSDQSVLELLESVLNLNNKSGDEFRLYAYDCAKNAKQIIERFIDSKPEWILERACEIANDDSDQ